jgi:N-acetylglucosaminyldiphosphoundecaprenol N-acetyl-beta-D-mannosaminyltransferase
MESNKSNNTVKIFGVKFDKLSSEGAYNKFLTFMSSDKDRTHMVFTPNAEIVMKAQEDPEFMSILVEGDLVIPDGIGVIIASKVHHLGLEERIPGIEMMTRILEYCNLSGKSIYLFGGKPGVSEKAAINIQNRYPNLTVKGHRDGFFEDKDSPGILDEINGLKPDVLFVALGAPKQEKWIYKNRKLLHTKVAMGVGGSLDVFAGTAKRAPVLFQKMGIEWLYRLLLQPSRIGRMMVLPKFLIKVFLAGPTEKS